MSVIIAMLGSLTACSDSNSSSSTSDTTTKTNSDSSISITGHTDVLTTYAKLESDASEIDYLFTSKLMIFGGVSADEADDLASGKSGYVAESDIAVVTLWLLSTKEKYIPSVSYTYVEISTTVYAEKNNFFTATIDYTPEGSTVGSGTKSYTFESGTMIVLYNNGNYTIRLHGKSTEGKSIVINYEGTVPFSELPPP